MLSRPRPSKYLDPKKGISSPFYLPKIGEPTEFKSFQLGGITVFLATPARVFSEEKKPLDRDLAMQGRLVELEALNCVRFGKIVSKKECDKYCPFNRHSFSMLDHRCDGREHRIYACGFAAWRSRCYSATG